MQLENIPWFFKTNTIFAKVESVVNVILEHFSGSSAWFSDIFRGYQKGTAGVNGFKPAITIIVKALVKSHANQKIHHK